MKPALNAARPDAEQPGVINSMKRKVALCVHLVSVFGIAPMYSRGAPAGAVGRSAGACRRAVGDGVARRRRVAGSPRARRAREHEILPTRNFFRSSHVTRETARYYAILPVGSAPPYAPQRPESAAHHRRTPRRACKRSATRAERHMSWTAGSSVRPGGRSSS